MSKSNVFLPMQLKEAIQNDAERFYYMFSPLALSNAQPYLTEERAVLSRLVHGKHLVVVGAGPLMYLDVAQKHSLSYTAIDPLIHLYVNSSVKSLIASSGSIAVHLVDKPFCAIDSFDIPSSPCVLIFHFNVAAYIDGFQYHLNKLLKNGDVLVISKWGNSEKSKKIRQNYFSYLKTLMPDCATLVGDLNREISLKDLQEIRDFKHAQKIENDVCEFIVVKAGAGNE
ncbi:MAG: hypothetical protein JXR76_01895 [Deltaproteobacteria bacterium]|nr:hypothetical protein [Deltaproteobacteria bacterium]